MKDGRDGTLNRRRAPSVVALAAIAIAYLYFKHRERQRRLEVIHQERVAAMDKGIPLPELAIDPPSVTCRRRPTRT